MLFLALLICAGRAKVVSALSSLGDRRQKAGVVGSTFSILKLIVGAGSFVLPAVTASIGFVGLATCLVLPASLAFYTSWLVVSLKQARAPKEDLSLSEFTADECAQWQVLRRVVF